MTLSEYSKAEIIKKSYFLERVGNYREAYKILTCVVDLAAIKPFSNTNNISPNLLLRIGAIYMYLANTDSNDGFDYAFSLIMKAKSEFVKTGEIKKIAECENYLALIHYFKSEYRQATSWIEESLSRKLNSVNTVRLHSHLIKSMILLVENKDSEVIEYLFNYQKDFKHSDYWVQGSFNTNLGLAQKNIGHWDESLKTLQKARSYHIKSKHLPYLACCENNLAQAYLLRSDYGLAFSHINSAIEIFSEINDQARYAFTLETKAQILLNQGEFESASILLDEPIQILREGSNSSFLSSVLYTKARALLYSNKLAESIVFIAEAINIAQTSGDNGMIKIAKSFESEILKRFGKTEEDSGHTPLKLDLPPQISPNQKLFPIKIQDDDFASLGLSSGTIAIAVYCSAVESDDLAVIEDNDGFVRIGFYSKISSLICITTLDKNEEPELFDQTEARLIGRILGYCDKKTNERGRYIVYMIHR